MNKIIINKAISDNDFVGIKIDKKIMNITFPVGYKINETEIEIPNDKIKNIQDIKILIKCLDLANLDSYEEGTEKFSFSSAFYIIEHYLKYGLYKKNNNQPLLNKNGKTDWKKTLNNTEPIYLRGKIIYNELYTRSNVREENIITLIQKHCLSVSTKILGWLYGIDYKQTEEINLSTNEMLYYLNKELYSINEDNKKNIIKEMINLISGTNTSNILQNKEVAIGRYHFDKVWEKILKKELFLSFNEYKCLPNTYYIDSNGNKITNSDLYPDMIIKEKDTIIIIDAKYYQSNTLPASSDICKQLFYAQYIKHKNKKCKMINMFILPKSLEKEYEYYGYASTNHSKKEEKILTYYLDTKSVLKDNLAIYKLINDLLKTA